MVTSKVVLIRSLLTKIMVDQNIINPKDVKVITKPTKDGTAGGSSSTSKQASQKEGEVSKKRKEIGPGDTPTSKKSKSSEYSLTEASLGNIGKLFPLCHAKVLSTSPFS